MTTRLRAGVRRARREPPRVPAAARLRETRRLGDPPALAGELGADSRSPEMARDPLEAGCRLARLLWPVCRPEPPAPPFPVRPLPSPKPGEPPATASPAVAERTPPQHSTATRAARRRATAIARPSERVPLRVSTRTRTVSSLSAPREPLAGTHTSVQSRRLVCDRRPWRPFILMRRESTRRSKWGSRVATPRRLRVARRAYLGSGSRSPGHEPVTLRNASREPRSTAVRTPAKTAPRRAEAIRTLIQDACRCSDSGGSWSSMAPHRTLNSHRPRAPARTPPSALIGTNRNRTPGLYPSARTRTLQPVTDARSPFRRSPMCPGWDSNPHAPAGQGLLRPPCLAISITRAPRMSLGWHLPQRAPAGDRHATAKLPR